VVPVFRRRRGSASDAHTLPAILKRCNLPFPSGAVNPKRTDDAGWVRGNDFWHLSLIHI